MTVIQSQRVRQKAVATKLARVRGGKPARVLDLFAGCGGLSLGFHAAGFTMAGAVEMDDLAARTHGRNFFPGNPRHAVPHDITATSPADLAARWQKELSMLQTGDYVVLVRSIDDIDAGHICRVLAPDEDERDTFHRYTADGTDEDILILSWAGYLGWTTQDNLIEVSGDGVRRERFFHDGFSRTDS